MCSETLSSTGLGAAAGSVNRTMIHSCGTVHFPDYMLENEGHMTITVQLPMLENPV